MLADIYSSLFRDAEKHELILKTPFEKGETLNRDELVKNTNIASGGTMTKTLNELEESGFIAKFPKFGLKLANSVYCISDFYTLFYFRFIDKASKYEHNIWWNKIDNPLFRTWSVLSFMQVCFSHIPQN